MSYKNTAAEATILMREWGIISIFRRGKLNQIYCKMADSWAFLGIIKILKGEVLIWVF
jgi:hypothetical protein